MVIDTGVLACAKLEKIYRQKYVPKLLEIIEHYHGERYEAALNQIKDLGVIRENDTRSDALKSVVRDTMEEFRAGQKPIIVEPVHRDGKDLVNQIESTLFKEPVCGFSSPKTRVVTEPRYLDLIWTTARYCWPCFPMAVTFADSGVMMRILQKGTHQLREFRVRRVVLLNYFFAPRIASFATLKTRDFITVLAGILIFCFVEGLNPGACFLLLFY